MAEEERQQQRTDVRPVDVGIRHDDDLAVAQLADVELVGADPGAESGDDRANLLVAQHLVDARLLHVEDLASQRKDRLERTVPALLRRTARRVALHQVELGLAAVATGAVGQLPGQAAARERTLAAHEVARVTRRLAGRERVDGLFDQRTRRLGVLLEVLRHLGAGHLLDDRLHLRVTQLHLGLALELGLGDLDADDGRDALAEVVAARRLGSS